MQRDVATATLGETRGLIRIESPEAYRHWLCAMARQAQRRVRVFSPSLEHALYSDPLLAEALTESIADRQRLHVRILVKDTRPASQRGHVLVELRHRLPSFIDIHTPPPDARDDRGEYAIFDDTGLIKRYPHSDFKGHAEFRTADAGVLARQFDAYWERSVPCHELMRISV